MVSATNDFILVSSSDPRAALGQPLWGLLRELFLCGRRTLDGTLVSRMQNALERDLWKHHYSQDEQKGIRELRNIRRVRCAKKNGARDRPTALGPGPEPAFQ